MRWDRIGMAALLWLCAASVQAQRMEAITLKGALPEQVQPMVQQVLQPGETVKVFRNQLIVVASDGSLQRVYALLEEIDRPPRNLRIEVSDTLTGHRQHGGVQASGSVGDDTLRVHVNEAPHPGGNHLTVEAGASRTDSSEQVRQQLRAVEGYPAFIASGQQAPLAVTDGQGRRVTVMQGATQGFFVTARLVGAQVFLDISASHDRLDAARLDTRRVQTTVSGRLGEWIELAGMGQQAAVATSGPGVQGSGTAVSSGSLYLRVRLAD